MITNKLSRGRYMKRAWQYDIRRRRRDKEPGVLTGVRKIAKYMMIGAETFYKLYQHHDLPAMRLPDGRWSTSKNLIDAWIVARWREQTGRALQGERGLPAIKPTEPVGHSPSSRN